MWRRAGWRPPSVWGWAVNPVERGFRRIDVVQQRHTPTAFVFGVIKKFGDDNAGTLVSSLAHSGFGTIFPLLLFLVTILGLVVGSHASLNHQILHSAVSQFPIVGNDLAKNIHSLRRNSVLGLVVGLVGMVWGSLGLAQSGIFAMEQVWNLPGPERPNYVKRLLRSVGFLSVIAVSTIITTFLTAAVAATSRGEGEAVAAFVVSVVINCGAYLVCFRVLTPGAVAFRKLFAGAVVAGVGWTILQEFGTLIVEHYLRDDSAVYGLFAIVIGLFTWIYFLAELTVYCAEINVVLDRHLWPRAIVQPPLTAADQRSMAAQAEQNRRRPEQHVHVSFDGRPTTQEEFLAEVDRKESAQAADQD